MCSQPHKRAYRSAADSMIAVLKMPMRAGYNLARMGIDRALSAALLWMKQGRPQAPMPSHRFGEMKNSGRGGQTYEEKETE